MKHFQKCYQNLRREGSLTSHNFNVEVPKKWICTRNLSRRRHSTTNMLHYDQDHFHRSSPPPMETVCSYIFKTVQRDSLFLGVLKCFICNKPDTNLCAAGVMQASKTAVNKHVRKTTEKRTTSLF